MNEPVRLLLVAAATWALLSPGALHAGDTDRMLRRWARTHGADPGGLPVVGLARVGGVATAVLALASFPGWRGPVLATAMIGAAVIGPAWAARRWAAEREQALARELPAFLRAWATTLDAGAFPWPGFVEAAREATPPLRLEVLRVQARAALREGTLAEILSSRAGEIGSSTLAEVAGVLATTERTGAPVATLLRRLADDVDARHAFSDQLDAASRGPQKEIGLVCVASVGMAATLPTLLAKMAPPGAAEPRLAPWLWAVLGLGVAVPVGVLARERRRARAEAG